MIGIVKFLCGVLGMIVSKHCRKAGEKRKRYNIPQIVLRRRHDPVGSFQRYPRLRAAFGLEGERLVFQTSDLVAAPPLSPGQAVRPGGRDRRPVNG